MGWTHISHLKFNCEKLDLLDPGGAWELRNSCPDPSPALYRECLLSSTTWKSMIGDKQSLLWEFHSNSSNQFSGLLYITFIFFLQEICREQQRRVHQPQASYLNCCTLDVRQQPPLLPSPAWILTPEETASLCSLLDPLLSVSLNFYLRDMPIMCS